MMTMEELLRGMRAQLQASAEPKFRVADALLEDPDDMVQKGVGWVLKEAYPKKPREVLQFLKARKERTPRLTLRIAAEKMTAKDRAEFFESPRRRGER